jgi:hypothetical protein
MRLKDGFQVCQKCGGIGCYWCRRCGWQGQCPTCCNSEPELLEKDEEGELTCGACGTVFDKGGQVVKIAEEKPIKVSKQKPT